jgi:ketosteroid isomerase-like protein
MRLRVSAWRCVRHAVVVADVYIGTGSLAGRGVYAARAFAEGEVVVPYRLRQLTRDEFVALSESEKLAVHSYFGTRYLYPSPARYVNHSDSPNMVEDFDRDCDIALCPIAAGEFLTVDATKETDRELATFLQTYEAAVNCADVQGLGQLVCDDAVLWWMRGRDAYTKDQMIDALRRVREERTQDLRLVLRDVRWMIGTGRWEAVCSADYEIEHGPFPSDRFVSGHMTAVLKVIEGNWQIIYQHLSRS